MDGLLAPADYSANIDTMRDRMILTKDHEAPRQEIVVGLKRVTHLQIRIARREAKKELAPVKRRTR